MSNNFGHRVAPDNSYYAFTRGTEDMMRFGDDNSGQFVGFRNVLINGKLSINQRGVTIAAAAIGTYGPDRWKKVDASNMTQIVEDGNYKYSSVYTLSGVGVTKQQVTSPASGHWTIPSIPITATYVQLEIGSIATQFENRPIGLELSLCQRYYNVASTYVYEGSSQGSSYSFPVRMRATPTAVCASTGFYSSALSVDGWTGVQTGNGLAAITLDSEL